MAARMLTPVVLPFGRAIEPTSPDPIISRVDVIVTAGFDEAIRAAQQATKTIPIVAMTRP
jgi:hypothetical protein